MKKMLISSILLFILVLSFSVTGLSGEKLVFKLAHTDPPNPFQAVDQAISIVFKNLVETKTNGNIEVKIYPANILGKERESMELLQNNMIQGYIATNGGLAPFFPLIGILDIPFAISDYNIAYKVFDGKFGKDFAEELQKKTGLKTIAITEIGGFYQITNNIRPVKSPEDLKNIKFRTMTMPSHINFFESLGASAVPVSWAEVYTSLQTGVVEGQHNPLNPIISAGLYEVQKYMTMTNHLYGIHWFLVNAQWFNKLSEEYQEIIKEAAKIANMAGRGLNRIVDASENGIPLLRENMEVYTPTAEELAAFAQVAVPPAKEFIKNELGERGEYWANRYLEAIEKAKEELAKETW